MSHDYCSRCGGSPTSTGHACKTIRYAGMPYEGDPNAFRFHQTNDDLRAEVKRLVAENRNLTNAVRRLRRFTGGPTTWERAHEECVVCPGCGFTFAAYHRNDDETGYSCPVCHTDEYPAAALMGATE